MIRRAEPDSLDPLFFFFRFLGFGILCDLPPVPRLAFVSGDEMEEHGGAVGH